MLGLTTGSNKDLTRLIIVGGEGGKFYLLFNGIRGLPILGNQAGKFCYVALGQELGAEASL